MKAILFMVSMFFTRVALAHPGHAEGNEVAHDVEHFFILLSASGLLLLVVMIAFLVFKINK